jgi:hypothetical protein
VKNTCPSPSVKELLSRILNDLRQPFKSKSVRDWEVNQGKNDPNAASQSDTLERALIGLMTENFKFRELVYNRVTKEDGSIQRVYKTNGAAMYEVAVPIQDDSWAAGYNISDWGGDVLQPSSNEDLKSSTFKDLRHI